MTSLANIRSAYAEAQASYLSEVASASNVTINKSSDKIANIQVADVKLAGVQSGWSLASDQTISSVMPNGVTWTALTDDLGGAAGTYTLIFTYGNDGTITLTNANKQ